MRALEKRAGKSSRKCVEGYGKAKQKIKQRDKDSEPSDS